MRHLVFLFVLLCANTADALPRVNLGAFDEPMTFAIASSGGNCSRCTWISAIGVITEKTPEDFRSIISGSGHRNIDILLHSPGGNIAAGLVLGKLIRDSGLSTIVARTTNEQATDYWGTWSQYAEPGECSGACAYTFLGGANRALDTEYHRMAGRSRIGFKQFPISGENGPGFSLSASDTPHSSAQILSGIVVAYAIEMGVDGRIFTLSSGVKPGETFYPPIETLNLLRVISAEGFGPWQVEVHKDGLVAFAKELSEATLVQRITLFCRQGSRTPVLMMTARNANPDAGTALGAVNEDFPKANEADFRTGAKKYRVGREFVSEQFTHDKRFFSVQLTHEILSLLLDAGEFEVDMDVANVFGFYHRQAETVQADRTALRENSPKLRIVRGTRRSIHLDQIRPHRLVRNRDIRQCDDRRGEPALRRPDHCRTWS
jgi:hypothetical protein